MSSNIEITLQEINKITGCSEKEAKEVLELFIL